MPFLQVDLGRGVREKVPVAPNTTLREVLSAACAKRGLDVATRGLRHGRTRKHLDLSITFRLSGLDNNALIEVVEDGHTAPRGSSQAPCRVAVQLESGDRRTGSLGDESSLLEVVRALCPEQLADGAMPAGHAPAILYGGSGDLRVVATGEDQLRSTTLASLGVARGSAVLVRFVSLPAEGGPEGIPAVPAAPPQPSIADGPAQERAVPCSGAASVAEAAAEAAPAPAQLQPSPADAAAAAADGLTLRTMMAEALRALQAQAQAAADADADADVLDGGGGAAGERSLSLLCRYGSNVMRSPHEARYRTIRHSNAAFKRAIGRHDTLQQPPSASHDTSVTRPCLRPIGTPPAGRRSASPALPSTPAPRAATTGRGRCRRRARSSRCNTSCRRRRRFSAPPRHGQQRGRHQCRQ